MMHFRSLTSKQTLVWATLLVATFAFSSVGCKGKVASKPDATETAKGALEAPARGLPQGIKDSDVVPVGNSYVKGPADAPITIVEFSEFQCPFCARGHSTITELLQKFPGKIRLVFRHFPLPFHQQAAEASAAALAAGEQGKFWEMHDVLFEKQGELTAHASDMKEWTTTLATGLGLDGEKFKADYDTAKASSVVDDDEKAGSKIGVNGTPAFFINGKRLVGAQPIGEFESVVNAELKAIEGLGDSVKPEDLYVERVKANYAEEKPPTPEAPPAKVIDYVPVNKQDGIKGNLKDPLVTIVEFSDFECPFCSRVNPTLKDLFKNYGNDIRIVFKQNPLGFHPHALPAAKAAVAAGQQGKFWEMHDKLFENQPSLADASLFERLAKEIGLNAKKFKTAFDSPEVDQQVKDDIALANKVGARGTPNFFINGVQLVGAQPYPAFEAEVKTQLEIAKKIKEEQKLSGEKLYEAVVKHNKENAPAPAPAAAPAPTKVDVAKLAQGKAYAKGPDNAPITIVEFSDFQCPFCSRGTNNLNEVLGEYKDKIRVVYKHYPLHFHPAAEPAARASIAAGRQGKFWEMHDKLFANQGDLGNSGIFEQYAKELGLNVDKFTKDFNSPEVAQEVKDDMAQGTSVGVNGTPAFFINGELISGAQPPAAFKAVIDRLL